PAAAGEPPGLPVGLCTRQDRAQRPLRGRDAAGATRGSLAGDRPLLQLFRPDLLPLSEPAGCVSVDPEVQIDGDVAAAGDRVGGPVPPRLVAGLIVHQQNAQPLAGTTAGLLGELAPDRPELAELRRGR